MKKFLSLVFAIVLTLSFNSVVFAESKLVDIADTKYEMAVEALEALNVINGYEDGTYRPYEKVTRAEMAKLLVAASNLNEAADYAKGFTSFSDVENHWAIGFINVAETAEFIKGYPDGRFLPEGKVTYAEAVTMAVRALGYGNVVEARGTYPTNYMNKANELGLLEGIEAVKYIDELERGDVATLLWNMLKTKMWIENGENEGDGVSYGESKEIMLTIKFPNYKMVEEGLFKDYAVSYDRKEKENIVKVLLTEDKEELELEYEGNDFYNFVSGEEISFVYNTASKKVLSLTSIQDGEKRAGYVKDFKNEDFYKELKAEDEEYVVFFLLDDEVVLEKTLDLSDEYVEELETRSNGIKVNENTIVKAEEKLVLIDNERKTIKDLDTGVVLTKVDNKFYIMSEDMIKGVASGANKFKATWVIDNVEYPIADSVLRYDEDTEEFVAYTPDTRMKDQEVVSYISAFGRHVRAELKELNEEKLTKGYYVAVTRVYFELEKDEVTYFVDLVDINGVKTYEVSGDAEIIGSIKNKFVAVNFEDGIITKIEEMNYNEQIMKVKGSYLYSGDVSVGKINSNSILVKIFPEEDGYIVGFDKGTEIFEKFNNKVQYVVVDDKLRIEYVVIQDINIDSDNLELGLVSTFDYDDINERYIVELENSNERFFLKEYVAGIKEGALIAFVFEEDNDLEVLNIREVARVDDIADNSNLIITKDMIAGARRLVNESNTIIDLDDAETWGDYNLNNYRFVEIEVEVEDDELVFGSYEELDLKEIKFKENDVIATGKNEDVFVIYRLTNEAKEFITK